ncbi:hypothetical protein SAMN05444422_10527 [Halobiforma haloterrestris]|uniref:Uncharacterized protein n=1 Tax=Natronobacterium haloterrestre TaxID=148448 RepID=A0A1I1GUE9_NATHA|nr:hypothetical protein [Halobiforma haloterrestris]SFC15141.1 hypothetical protein SAMN05444422_10527 [Halobiforma haloterrestris]
MPQKYEFERIESDGQEYVIADPVNQTDDPVRLDARWIEGDDVEGEWERAVRAIIKTDLLGSMELKEGNGRIDRRRAIETLASASDEEGDIVTSEQQAEALLEFFADEDILELQGGQVVMLRNPSDNPDEINGRMILNWAAAIDACVEKITETIDRVDSAKQKLENRMDDIDQDSGKIDEHLEETAQELRSLGDGAGVPEDPSTLPAEERERFQQLKRKLIYHKKMKEADQENLAEKVESGTARLADNIEMLESAKSTLANKREQVRTQALKKQTFPDEAMNIVDNMGELTTQLAGVGGIEEAIEETPDHEVGSVVDDVLGNIESVGETAQQTAGEEVTEADGAAETETSELEMS